MINEMALDFHGLTRRIACAALLMAACVPVLAQSSSPCPELLRREVPRLQDEKMQNLCQYAGKVVLVVNTASFCGFTRQYRSLEALYRHYKERGFVVLGFPSNDFGAQEPGSNKEIAEFCENTFDVKFPMFAKSAVKTGDSAPMPLFADLGRLSGQLPRWNFHKYLISRNGREVLSFASNVDPASDSIVKEVERLLALN